MSHKIIREFSQKTLALEGEQRILGTLMNLELALIDINNDYLNLKMGLLALLKTNTTAIIL